ncbi:Tsr1 protein [Capsaspora owczarzaki ATCC 30864]|uniref:Tsr1 protein n=1 Tax=Capsaspora owczarzaki (strain ATCC 30864) TaxID=595528 RepID=A0A0D2X443_CAPO3|nr:Tsr1 protein [Capsaspora owczarzaki ATCC 30864]KJE95409.1 Tsr1 protein [Capsaspora owczarzaki ATCC 30864]|eukprot:XP_004345453.1 Tsr1 protein [Capsaspora owczarzaki ATCC 30864]
MDGASHRPGKLKQQNKSHKTGRHRAKGVLDTANKGRMIDDNSSRTSKRSTSSSDAKRQDRRNHLKQQMKAKRIEALAQRRGIGQGDGAPVTVAILPLCADVDARQVRAALIKHIQGNDAAAASVSDSGMVVSAQEDAIDSRAVVTVAVPKFKSRLTLVTSPNDLFAQCDAAIGADVVLFVLSHSVPVSEAGELLISNVRSQGVPSVSFAVNNLEEVPPRRRADLRKFLLSYASSRFSKQQKLFAFDSDSEASLLVRHLCDSRIETIHWRDRHPYMLADHVGFSVTDSTAGTGILSVTGFLRGRSLDVNGLVHLRNFGDFQIGRIDGPNDPYSLNRRNATGKKQSQQNVAQMDTEGETEEVDEHGNRILARPSAEQQQSLVSEIEPDPMSQHQTWPTVEEMKAALRQQRAPRVLRVPKGTSEYQAAWIVEDGDRDEDDNGDEDSGDEDDENAMAMATEFDDDAMDGGDAMQDGGNDEDEEEYEDLVEETADAKYDAEMNFDDEEQQLEHRRRLKEQAADEDTNFPDEIDTPRDVQAYIRFQKYRGLESFRASPWDPKENLPLEYARIFQFEDFERTKKRVLQSYEGVESGSYITVHIQNVPVAAFEDYRPEIPFLLFGLLEHENKMSVCNIAIQRTGSFEAPIRAKEPLLFQVGFRRFTAEPIYSTHTLGSKHKMERFLHLGRFTIATIICPLVYPTAPVLVFKAQVDGSLPYVGSGTLLSVDPDRIVLKRIILSGVPYKINRRSAVIRFMFFNRDDIDLYKRHELYTKHGRRGHIKGPIGTHGHMSVTFDRQLVSQDTVCLNLYKRVFPKWTYQLFARPNSIVPLDYFDVHAAQEAAQAFAPAAALMQ